MDESQVTQVITDRYALYLGDCLDVMPQLPDGSVHFSIYSPPFAGLYQYSSSPRDLSNSRSYQEFLDHYEFVVNEIYRLTMDGRLTAVHCTDIPSGNTGKDDTLMDFPADIIEMHVKCRNPNCTASPLERRKGLCGHGWFGHTARYHIRKEPLTVRNRLMLKRLNHSTIVDDSSRCGVANADYLLLFRRRGENPEPIEHPMGLTEYYGEMEVPYELHRYRGWQGNQIENRFSHWIWRRYADTFWDDIRIDNVLSYQDCREKDDEAHVHPLQLDVIYRAVELYSNRGDIVFTPFMGVGSEVFGAARLGRIGVGIELKASYFRQAIANLETVDTIPVFKPMLPGFEGME